jgi:hypothetical protein
MKVSICLPSYNELEMLVRSRWDVALALLPKIEQLAVDMPAMAYHDAQSVVLLLNVC